MSLTPGGGIFPIRTRSPLFIWGHWVIPGRKGSFILFFTNICYNPGINATLSPLLQEIQFHDITASGGDHIFGTAIHRIENKSYGIIPGPYDIKEDVLIVF